MEATLQEKFAIDKTNWTPVKFGDVVFEPKESTNNPVKDGIEHVVGLEHIDTENIHLNKSASIEESTTFSKIFAVGDVLFGRRRAYLKKAAQASFNGICSGDITVFRAKENLMPELLPFIVNNEKFFDYAIKHSAGGLSPRVKFKDLANYEFLLPPKEQQAQLAELLWAMDDVIERVTELSEKIKKLILRSRIDHFKTIKGKEIKLGQIAKIRAGVGFPLKFQGSKNDDLKFYKVGDMNSMGNERYMRVANNTISLTTLDKIKGKLHEKGTVVFPKVGAAIATEKKRILFEESLIDNNTMGVTLTSNSITPEYLHSYFDSISLEKISNNGTVPSINASIIQELKIKIPSEKELNKYMVLLEQFYNSKNHILEKISISKALQKSLINQIF